MNFLRYRYILWALFPWKTLTDTVLQCVKAQIVQMFYFSQHSLNILYFLQTGL